MCFDWTLFQETFLAFRNERNDRIPIPGNQNQLQNIEEEHRIWMGRNTFWMTIATVFIAITLILWEVAIAVIVYDARVTTTGGEIDPKNFAILEDASEEYQFKRLIGYEPGKEIKWNRSRSYDEQFDILNDPKNEIDSAVVYEVFHRYEMKQNPGICEKLRLHENGNQPQISGVWFFSGNVPLSNRTGINHAITELKDKGTILKIVGEIAGTELPDNCMLKDSRIDWVLLALLHTVITAIPSAILILSIGWVSLRRRRRRRRMEIDTDTDAE